MVNTKGHPMTAKIDALRALRDAVDAGEFEREPPRPRDFTSFIKAVEAIGVSPKQRGALVEALYQGSASAALAALIAQEEAR